MICFTSNNLITILMEVIIKDEIRLLFKVIGPNLFLLDQINNLTTTTTTNKILVPKF